MNELNVYKNIKDKDLKIDNIFIGEGRYIVQRMIDAHYKIHSILCTPESKEYYTDISQGAFPVIDKTKAELLQITGFRFHRGVLAAAQRPEIPDVSTFLASSPHITHLVVLPSLSEAENMGSIIRSAIAFSFHGIAIGPGCIDPFNRKAIRSSMGNVFEIPLSTFTHHHEVLSLLKKHGFHVIGTSPSDKVKRLKSFSVPEKSAIVFGHESEGLPLPWDSACDNYLQIKINKKIDSLNVGVAAGIFFYEFSKQRKQ